MSTEAIAPHFVDMLVRWLVRVHNRVGKRISKNDHNVAILSEHLAITNSYCIDSNCHQGCRWNGSKSKADLLSFPSLPSASQGLNHWTKRLEFIEESTNDQSVQGVLHSFQILDQLVKDAEEQQVLQSLSALSQSSTTEILPALLQSSDVLNKIVYNWSRLIVERNARHSIYHNFKMLEPQQLIDLLDDYQRRLPCLYADVKTYSMILHVLAKQQQQLSLNADHSQLNNMSHLANAIFHRMNESNDDSVRPDIITFNTVLNTLAQSSSPMAAQVAEDTLMLLLEQSSPLSSHHINDSLQPDAITFNTVMSAWAKAGMPERAEQVFHKMQELYQTTGNARVKPTVHSYGTLISAWGNSGKPKKAQAYFDEMCSRFSSSSNASASTNSESSPQVEQYNGLLRAWALAGFTSHCESLLLRMMQSSLPKEEATGNRVQPNTTSFTIVLDAYARSDLDPEGAERAQDLFFKIITYHNNSATSTRPDAAVYCTMMNVWNRHAHHHPPQYAFQRAMEIFQAMPKADIQVENINVLLHAMAKSGNGKLALSWLKKELPAYRIKPDVITYSTVLSAISAELRSINQRSADKNNVGLQNMKRPFVQVLLSEQQRQHQGYLVRQAEKALETMQARGIHPNARVLAALTGVYLQVAGTDADVTAKAQVTLEKVIELICTSESSSSSDDVNGLIRQILEAWIQVGACHHAELFWWQLWDKVASLSDDRHVSRFITTHSLNVVLQGWCGLVHEDPKAAERAEALLRKVEQKRHELPKDTIEPNAKSYREVLAAWGEHPNGQSKVEQLWQERISRLKAGEIQLELNISDYNVMMRAMLNFGNSKRVKELFDELESAIPQRTEAVRPNVTTFNIMMEIECKESAGGNGPDLASDWFQKMIQRYDQGEEFCQPTRHTFRVLMNAWISSKTSDGHVRADHLLGAMLQQYKDGNLTCRPQLYEYHAVIEACTKAGDVERAEDRLLEICTPADHLQHIRPNTVTFNVVLTAMAKSRQNRAAERAEKFLRIMEEAGQDLCRPSAVSYTSVIQAWGNSQHPDALKRIEALLDAMTQQWVQKNDHNLRPDVFTFAAVIRAIARSDKSDKPQRLRNMLRRMTEAELKPNSHVIEAVLLGCSNTRGNKEERRAAFDLALEMLHLTLLQWSSVKPLPSALLFFLKTLAFVAEPSPATLKAAYQGYEVCQRLGFDSDPRIQKAFQQSIRADFTQNKTGNAR